MPKNYSGAEAKKRKKQRLLKESPYCLYCHKKLDYKSATLDHLIPKSKGGTMANINLALSCFKCNMQKADKIIFSNII